MSLEITPKELQDKLAKGEPIFLLDVREHDEFQIANLGGTLIPLSQLETRMDDLQQAKDREVIVLCHHGIRSRHAASFLRQQGFAKVLNLSGGIDRYSFEVDPKIPRY